MPKNKNALIRYIAIDKRLRYYPMPTLECLIKAVSNGIDGSVSKRTVQLDLQEMRHSTGLSFNAPIKCIENKKSGKMVYRYSVHRWTLAKRIQAISDGLIIQSQKQG